MLVEIWSDVVCPWCYIGKRRFEQALSQFHSTSDGAVSIDVRYRPFQLDPTAAPGVATPVLEAYAKKFGGQEQATAMIERVTEVAAAEGLEFRLDQALRANTLLAHQALWLAESDPAADQAALKEALLRAYFVEGLHVGDPDVVAASAVDAGMDEARLRHDLEEGTARAPVLELLAVAASTGITAVPTYVFNGQWAVPGAQDVELFVRVLTKMAARAEA